MFLQRQAAQPHRSQACRSKTDGQGADNGAEPRQHCACGASSLTPALASASALCISVAAQAEGVSQDSTALNNASAQGNTALNYITYGLFLLCAVALVTLTVGVAYLSLENWRNSTDDKRERQSFDPKDAEYGKCATSPQRP